MVWEKPKDGMLNELDWLVLGHDLYNKSGIAVLPARRFDIPMPYSPDGLHTLAHRLSGLAETFHRLAREGQTLTSPRLAIGDAQSQVHQLHKDLKRLRKEWETELRERLTVESSPLDAKVRLRSIG